MKTNYTLAEVQTLVEATNRGERSSAGVLAEALTSTDAILQFGRLINKQISLDWQNREDPLNGDVLVGDTLPVSDFSNITRYKLNLEWDTPGTLGTGNPYPVAPEVPELAPYPEAYITGQSAEGANIRKYGFRFGFSWEALLADTVGFIRQIPEQLRQVALNTEDARTWEAVKSVTSTQQLAGGVNVEGETVVANAPLSRDALLWALQSRATRTNSTGRAIDFTGTDYLVVAKGQKLVAEYVIKTLKLEKVTKTDRQFTVPGYDPLAGIVVVESAWVTGTNWYLVNVQRDGINKIKLIGHEAPELRISNFSGNYIGGAPVPGNEGSMINDDVAFRLRYPVESVLWEPNTIVWSTGAGS